MQIPELQDWINNTELDYVTREELLSLQDQQEIQDRFSTMLKFGTGGLRGKMEVGNNRLNRYTIGQATQGLCDYLCQKFKVPSVCIGYDTRHHSLEFAQTAAQIFCANGIKVFMFSQARPTPMLSWLIGLKKASAGIVITASHNAKEYNGYKVYNEKGFQITKQTAREISIAISNCDIFNDVKKFSYKQAFNCGLINIIGAEIEELYLKQVETVTIRKNILKYSNTLNILYTPLYGTGNGPVQHSLQALGYKVTMVTQQATLDGNFPTAPRPNPEDPSVFRSALDLAKTSNQDVIFATDPDCDRIGVMCRDKCGTFVLLTGNQLGALLCDYIIKSRKEHHILPDNSIVVKTIVTTDMIDKICEKEGINVVHVLTGFKYIGELSAELDKEKNKTFLFGVEESCGYLTGNFVFDKDAVIASVLVAEMSLYYKLEGLTLLQALEVLYKKIGYFREKSRSFNLDKHKNVQYAEKLLNNLRYSYREVFPEDTLVYMEDYKYCRKIDCRTSKIDDLPLASSNVLKFHFADDSWFAIRPSGTESKIKLYLSIMDSDSKLADMKMGIFENLVYAALKYFEGKLDK